MCYKATTEINVQLCALLQTQTDRTVATYNERFCVAYRFHVCHVNKQFS